MSICPLKTVEKIKCLLCQCCTDNDGTISTLQQQLHLRMLQWWRKNALGYPEVVKSVTLTEISDFNCQTKSMLPHQNSESNRTEFRIKRFQSISDFSMMSPNCFRASNALLFIGGKLAQQLCFFNRLRTHNFIWLLAILSLLSGEIIYFPYVW